MEKLLVLKKGETFVSPFVGPPGQISNHFIEDLQNIQNLKRPNI